MPINPYYNAKANSKGWPLVSVVFADYDESPADLFRMHYAWCQDNDLKLMTDFNCREVGGRNARFDFWFKDKAHAALFSGFASGHFLSTLVNNWQHRYMLPYYIGRDSVRVGHYENYKENKIKNGWIKVSLTTDTVLDDEFAFDELVSWCKEEHLLLTVDYDHRARAGDDGVAIDFWFKDKEKAMLFKLTFV
jgi:hypothetical protein